MTNRLVSTLRIGLVVLALGVLAPPALAQSGGGNQTSENLSAEDVSENEIEAAANIIVAMQMQRQEMRTNMREKYGNPQEMDSTQRRKARVEIMERRQTLMQKKTEEEGLDAERLGLIMKSARQDSTLRKRLKTKVQDLRQEKMGGPRMQRDQDGPSQDSPSQDSSSQDDPRDGNESGGSGGGLSR